MLNERLNVNYFGFYKPAPSAIYGKQSKTAEMISTSTHEAVHHFPLSTTLMGKMIKEMDLIYEIYKKGDGHEVKVVIDGVSDDHSRIFTPGYYRDIDELKAALSSLGVVDGGASELYEMVARGECARGMM